MGGGEGGSAERKGVEWAGRRGRRIGGKGGDGDGGDVYLLDRGIVRVGFESSSVV